MTRHARLANRNVAFVLLVVLMIAVGCIRIWSTYGIFSQTWDEPFHIAAGMEWLDKGRYTYELFHPPLARIMTALGPYLEGIRSVDSLKLSLSEGRGWFEGNAILQSGGLYERNLMLARLGILPFFVICSLLVAVWANYCAGQATSLLATLLFTTLPPILAHSGLATLDMACAALVTAALMALTVWLKKPTFLHSFLLGIVLGLAILTKLSAIGYLLVSGALTVAISCLNSLGKQSTGHPDSAVMMGSDRHSDWASRRRFIAAGVALLFCATTIWAGYRFSFAPLVKADRPVKTEQQEDQTNNRMSVAGEGSRANTISLLRNTSVPAPEFLRGLNDFRKRNKQGHVAYLMGEIREQGWWYFFPVVLLFKTPLAFVVLSVIGYLVILRHFRIQLSSEKVIVPAIAAIGILAVSLLGHVNNGLRQILSIYPLLAIVAGYGTFKLMSLNSKYKFAGLALATLLLSWQLMSSFASHPDYLAYFNELAGNQPERIVGESDLDWGQDLKRLALILKQRDIKEFKIKYNGSIGLDLDKFNLPPRQELKPYQSETGWIAISIRYLQVGASQAPYDQYSWLTKYQPVEKVGRSIWLYSIPGRSLQ